MSLTIIICVITGLISYNAFSNRELFSKLLFRPVSVDREGEYYRFLTSGFVHGDMNHLFINLFVLYQFGTFIESAFNASFGDAMGRIVFIVLYFGAIILSSVPTYFKHQNNPGYSAVGASGGTSAIVFAYVVFNPWGWFIFPPLPALLFAVGYLFYSSYMGKKGGDNIGHDAHFWGAIFGLLVTILAILAFNPDLFETIIGRFMAGPSSPF